MLLIARRWPCIYCTILCYLVDLQYWQSSWLNSAACSRALKRIRSKLALSMCARWRRSSRRFIRDCKLKWSASSRCMPEVRLLPQELCFTLHSRVWYYACIGFNCWFEIEMREYVVRLQLAIVWEWLVLGVADVRFLATVTTACAKRTGAAASMERRRR